MKMIAVTRDDEGSACVFIDATGKDRPALITRVWGPQCVNVVYVRDDGQEDGQYGLKLERCTSVMHREIQQAHGNYWYKESENA